MQTQRNDQSKQVVLPKSKNYRSNMGMQRILCLCRIVYNVAATIFKITS